MTTKKNAAQVAVEAAAWPSAKQIQYMACQLIATNISNAISFVVRAGEWDDSFQDSINVAELARDSARSLASSLPLDTDDFLYQFFRVGSAATLARDAFPDKTSPVWRSLNSAVTGFNDVFHALELVDELTEKGGANGS